MTLIRRQRALAIVQYTLGGVIGLYMSSGAGTTVTVCFVGLSVLATACARTSDRSQIAGARSHRRSPDHPSLRVMDPAPVETVQTPERELALASRAS